MSKKIIEIIIFNQNIAVTEKIHNALISESMGFELKINLINKLEEIDSMKKRDILIIDVDKNLDFNLEKLKTKFKNIIIIDKFKLFLTNTFKNSNKVYLITEIQDYRVLAFNIIYNYYTKYKNEKELYEKRKCKKNSKKVIQKFNEYINKDELIIEIDKILMQGTNTKFNGYKELSFMIMFCIINKINIKRNKKYEYIYNAIELLYKEKWYIFNKNIRGALLLLRKRKNRLYIQTLLEKIKGKTIIEQVILISQHIDNILYRRGIYNDITINGTLEQNV